MNPPSPYVTHEQCEETRTACRAGRSNAIMWLIGLLVVAFLAVGGALVQTTVDGAAKDAQQDTRINEVEKSKNENFQLVRDDLKEIKQMLKERK